MQVAQPLRACGQGMAEAREGNKLVKKLVSLILTLSQILLSLEVLSQSQVASARSAGAARELDWGPLGSGMSRQDLIDRLSNNFGRATSTIAGLSAEARVRATALRDQLAAHRIAGQSLRAAGGVANALAGATNESAQTLFLIISLFVVEAVQTRIVQSEYRGVRVSPAELKAFVTQETDYFIQRVETLVALSGAAFFEFPVSVLVDHMTSSLERRLIFQSAVRAFANTFFALGVFAFADQLVRDAIELEPLGAERSIAETLEQARVESGSEPTLKAMSQSFRALSYARNFFLNPENISPQDRQFVNRLMENMSAVVMTTEHRQTLFDNTFRHQFANGDFAVMAGVVTVSQMGSMIMSKSIYQAAGVAAPLLARSIAGIAGIAAALSTGSITTGAIATAGAAIAAPALTPVLTSLVAGAIGLSVVAAGMLIAIYVIPDSWKDFIHSSLRSVRDSYLEARATSSTQSVLYLKDQLERDLGFVRELEVSSVDPELVRAVHDRILSRGKAQLARSFDLLEKSHFQREKLASSLISEFARYLERYRESFVNSVVVNGTMRTLELRIQSSGAAPLPEDVPDKREWLRAVYQSNPEEAMMWRNLNDHLIQLGESVEYSRNRLMELAAEFESQSQEVLGQQWQSFEALSKMRQTGAVPVDAKRLGAFVRRHRIGVQSAELVSAVLWELIELDFNDEANHPVLIPLREMVLQISARGYNERQIAQQLSAEEGVESSQGSL